MPGANPGISASFPGGTLLYSWRQPSQSMLSEGAGPDANMARGTVQVLGDPQTRRNAGLALLEYPVLLKVVAPNKGTYISRQLPLGYPTPIWQSPDDNLSYLWANKFTGGRGVGPKGKDTQTPPFPLYKFYEYDIEFTDRTYDILPDNQVLGSSPLAPPNFTSLTVIANGANWPFTANAFFVVTAFDGNGETLPSNERNLSPVPANASVQLSWNAVPGAIGYNVYYGNAAGQEYLLLFTLNDGTATGVGLANAIGQKQTPPTVNGTGSPIAGHPDEGDALAHGNGTIGSRYVTRNSRQVNRGVTIPRGLYGYTALDGSIKTAPEGILQVQPAIELVYTWHMVPRAGVPNQAILKQEGTINGAPFDSWPAGTLLLDGIEKRYYRSPIGGRVIDIQYRMTALPNIDRNGAVRGHNSTLQYIGGSPPVVDYVPMAAVTVGLGNVPLALGNPPFRATNYANLFRPDQ